MEENGNNRFTPGSSICSGPSNGIRKLGDTGCQKTELMGTVDSKSMKKSEAAWMALAGSAPLKGNK